MNQLQSLTRFATVTLLTAANEELQPARPAALVEPAPRPTGWDPFEIWRTRVRDARRDAEEPAGR